MLDLLSYSFSLIRYIDYSNLIDLVYIDDSMIISESYVDHPVFVTHEHRH